MKITAVGAQVKNKDRVNIMVDGAYRFSLDIFQLGDLGIRVGKEYTEEELVALERESQFGKLYSRTLNYVFMRLHSEKEIRDYLWRVSQPKLKKDGGKTDPIPVDVGDRVMERLKDKGYINDVRFAEAWVENRAVTRGASKRKLSAELMAKGVSRTIIETALNESERDEKEDLRKMIEKKAGRYDDEQKLVAYLSRQGFTYDDIRDALRGDRE